MTCAQTIPTPPPAGSPPELRRSMRVGAVQLASMSDRDDGASTGAGRANAGDASPAALHRVAPAKLLLIVPAQGRLYLACEAESIEIAPGQAALIARSDVTIAAAGANAAPHKLIWLSRPAVQAEASRVLGDARRIAPALHILDLQINAKLASRLGLGPNRDHRAVTPATTPSLIELLVDALSAPSAADLLFPRSRSVTVAVQLIHKQCDRAWDLPSLAAATNVTVETLRKGFKSCLNQSVSAYLHETRLQHARTSLASGRDSRTIAEVAASVGFKTPGSLSRAYARRFGETPSQTRSSAVKSNGGR